MRYKGQWFEINVPLDESDLEALDLATAAEKFHQIHHEQFGYSTQDNEIEVLNIRLAATGHIQEATQNSALEAGTILDAHLGQRDIWSPLHRKMVEANIYDGSRMGPGAEISGPAIVELGTTSIVVLDEYDAVVDISGSFVMYLREREEEMRARIQTGSVPANV